LHGETLRIFSEKIACTHLKKLTYLMPDFQNFAPTPDFERLIAVSLNGVYKTLRIFPND
jgi:hypothetical protein